MSRGPSRWGRANERRGSRIPQQKGHANNKDKLLERMKAAQKRQSKTVPTKDEEIPRLQRDHAVYQEALKAVPFYALGDPKSSSLSDEYSSIVDRAILIANSGNAEALLVWPPERFSPSAVVDLMAIASIGSAQRNEALLGGATTYIRREADPVRAVVFPYARSTHSPSRRVQVDAQAIGETNFDHFKREFCDNNDAVKDYHHVVSRVKVLDGRTTDGEVYQEFQHPVLDELVPHGPPRISVSAKGALLWRTHRKTDIGKLARSRTADNPDLAHFFIYEVREGDRLGVALRSISTSPDLLLLDLTRTGRQRLGWNWSSRAREMVECVQTVHSSAGILAITDDPWAYNAIRFEILGTRKYGKKGKIIPAAGRTVLALSGDILSQGITPEFEQIDSIQVDGFYGEVGDVSQDLRLLATKVSDAGDAAAADLVRDLGAMVRRTASLPGSVIEFSQFLEKETSAAMASDKIAGYRSSGLIKELSGSETVTSQIDSGEFVRGKVSQVMAKLTDATPMSTLLDDTLAPSLRSSSKSIFIFRSDMIAEFAADRLSNNEKLMERLASGMIIFGGSDSLDAIAASTQSARNQFKRVVLVAPTRAMILRFFARSWVPANVTVLADADTLAYSARDAERLSSDLAEHSISNRLAQFAEAAAKRAMEIGRHATNLDKLPPLDDVEPRDTSVIDLSGGGRGERELIEFSLHSGQRILARKGTALVLRDDAAATISFVERSAVDVEVGDEICAIGPAFIERARSLVNIRAAAAEEIRTYHELVQERFQALPGTTTAAKIRSLIEAMGEPKIRPENARYWVSIDAEIDKPMHEVVPHAPQEKAVFMRFTQALGIGSGLAENFWLWAIVAQRSHRMRWGNIFHDAFRGILTDPHAALAQNRNREADIRALRTMAEDHVSTVHEVKRVRSQ